jgi:hypothetical protein
VNRKEFLTKEVACSKSIFWERDRVFEEAGKGQSNQV